MRVWNFCITFFCLIYSGFLIGQNQEDTAKCTLMRDTISKKEYYLNTDTPPKYPEGNELMFAYLKNNIKVPDKCYKKSQIVFLSYIVETSGKLSLLYILRSSDAVLANELMRVIGTMPKWIPATCNKKPVPGHVIIPFRFTVK